MKMAKEKLRRAISMTLALAMTLSMFSVPGFSPAAKAAEELSPHTEQAEAAETVTTALDEPMLLSSTYSVSGDTTKPQLYIDFLGDTTTMFSGVPTDTDQSFAQSAGDWKRYGPENTTGDYTTTVPGTVFWVGVGIDKMTAFELAKNGGLTGLELGFYYNTDYVVPWMGDGSGNTPVANVNSYTYNAPASFKNILQQKNLSVAPNALNQWNSGDYEIVEAVPSRKTVMDADTQETIINQPNNTTIQNSTNWEMLYVSLEKKPGTGNNRFADATALNDSSIYYVMMLPFVLKKYDADQKICFRLSLNASVFSMGNGVTGAGTYDDSNTPSGFGAWEKQTRTPNHNLKEMFTFEGDLNIFTGKNEPDQTYQAQLSFGNGGSAKLYPTASPSISINTSGDILSGLSSGEELTLEVSKNSNTTSVGVTVIKSDGTTHSYTEVKAGEKYTFVMPTSDVVVKVTFDVSMTNSDDYKAELTVIDHDGWADNKAALLGQKADGTSVTIAADYNAPSASGDLKPGSTVTLHVDNHPDYKATVEVKTKAGSTITVSGPVTNVNGGVDYTFTMPQTDVEAKVTYSVWPSFKAELGVDTKQDGSTDNKATLSFKDYGGGTPPTTPTPVTKSVTLNGQAGGHVELGPIPQNRELTLDVEVKDGYSLSEVRLYTKDSNGNYTLVTVNNTNNLAGLMTQVSSANGITKYQTPAGLILMPNSNILVKVVFVEDRDYSARLVLDNGSNAEMTGNKKDGTSNSTNMTATPKVDTIWVKNGNQVTITLAPVAGKVVDTVEITPKDNPLDPNVSYTGTISSGTLKFTMPAYNVIVKVRFKDEPKYKATLVLEPSGSVADAIYKPATGTTTGWPQVDNAVYDRTNPAAMDYPTKYNILPGDTPAAWVDLNPGWYISNIRVVGRNGDTTDANYGTGSGTAYVPLNVSGGNGYNNGNGGLVKIRLTQPSEDVTVYVTLKQGVPPVEPEQGLTLRVEDPDNVSNPAANNWAKVSVGTAASPKVTKTTDNPYTITDVTSGDLVTVEYQADTGYYVSDVVVTPSGYGIVPTVGATGATFYMPAGSATVTVKFAKKDPANPPYTATLYVIGADTTTEYATLTNNGLAAPNSVTSDGTTTPSLSAWPGDSFTTEALVNKSAVSTRGVFVEVYRGGSLISTWSDSPNTVPTGTVSGSFVMPFGDVKVYVRYMDNLPNPNQKRIALTAYGLSGEAEGVAGEAWLTINGTNMSGAPAKSNDNRGVPTLVDFAETYQTIQVKALPSAGYVVDKIVYTTSAYLSPTELAAPAGAGSREVRFTMPATAVSVEVYFRKGDPVQHRADIVIRPPAGVSAADVGDAQFYGSSISDLKGYWASAAAGTTLNVWAYAKNGYYISKIEITPTSLGVMSTLTGVFSNQTLGFVMPDADCVVNVYYEKGWPEDSTLRATLRTYGPSGTAPDQNWAKLYDTSKTPVVSTSQVVPVDSSTLISVGMGDTMKVELNVANGYSIAHPITVTDVSGNSIPYLWTGTNEITFTMPNTWVYVDVTFKEGPDTTNLNATLHFNAGAAVLASGTQSVNTDGSSLTGLHLGNRLDVTVSSVPAGKTPVVTVLTASGYAVTVPALTESSGTYTTHFFMQNEDVDVYVKYVKTPDPNKNEYIANLIVTEIGGGGHGSWAQMWDSASSTSAVYAQGSDAIVVVAGNTVSIATGAGTGYVLDTVKVNGSTVSVTQDNTDPTRFTFTMPAQDATVVVTYKPWTNKKLTAQVIVNNGGGAGNNALLRKDGAGTALGSGVSLLTGLDPSDKILVDLTVQTGYKVDIIMVYPNGGGTVSVSPMTLPANQDQTVHFYMPADDVIVYVRFVADGETRYNITMTVNDTTTPTPNYSNTANIHTTYSGTMPTTGGSKHGDPAVTVQGAANDVVTVTANPQIGYWVEYKAVLDNGAATPTGVPDLTVSPDGKTATFSVPNSNVKVTVIFHKTDVDPPPEHKVTLHVIGSFTTAAPTALTDFCVVGNTFVEEKNASPANRSDASSATLVSGTTHHYTTSINVQYLKTVSVGGEAATGYYLQSAYAVCGSTMLPATNVVTSPASGSMMSKSFDFTMQNGDVDVYVVITDTPPAGKYTAKLEVTGPTETDAQGNPVIGAAGSAVLTNTIATPNVSTVSVGSNKTFDPATDQVTANANDTLTVTVTVNPGYSIDRVVVTPLGLNILPTSITTDSNGAKVYTYKMPASDIGILVILKSDNVDQYKVTLHLTDPAITTANGVTTSVNSTEVSYSVYSLKTDGANMKVPAAQYVTVKTVPGSGYYVHHAYAVTKTGAVQPLVDASTPPNYVSLQHPSTVREARFLMPAEDVDVYIEFSTTPPDGDLSAMLTVIDSDPSHSSSAKLERVGTTASLTANSGSGVVGPMGVDAGDSLKLTLNIAAGYVLDSVTVTGTQAGATAITVTKDANNSNLYTFTMPAFDVGVVVKIKSAEKYTATLHIVDHSSILGGTASMTKSGTTTPVATGDGAQLTGLDGSDVVETVVTPVTGTRVSAVIATDGTGTHLLTLNSGHYDYTMQNQNVDITVILDNDGGDMYVATVYKDGPGKNVAGNTAAITNTSNPALPNGTIWTGICGETPMQRLQIDVTTTVDYFVTITATLDDGTDLSGNLIQIGVTGTVTGYLDVPSSLYNNIIIKVEYQDIKLMPIQYSNLSLELVNHDGLSVNTAAINDTNGTILSVDGTSPFVGPVGVMAGDSLTLAAFVDTGYYVVSMEMIVTTSSGTTMTVSVPWSGMFGMPIQDTKVVVTLGKGSRTGRPHDWDQHPSSATAYSGYIDGFLYGQNLGSNQAKIPVSNLYSINGDTKPAYALGTNGNKYEYNFYINAGGTYVKLNRGVDYAVPTAYSFTPNANNQSYCSGSGWAMTIASLKGESALSEILLNGGVLYITAIDADDPTAAESEYVEVVIPVDPKKGTYTATLHIVDISGVSGNTASMTANNVTVSSHGSVISGLNGNELVRTLAQAATGAKVGAVTVTTASMGTQLLSQVPSGYDRYPYYMCSEDVIITVYFTADGTDPDNPTRYIASVVKTGDFGVSGNNATIKNDTRNDLSKGTIWAEGYESDNMRVSVDVAAGYYATLTAVNQTTGATVYVTALGAGPGVTSFDALLTMPAANVQVTVNFSKEPPENLKNKLELQVVDPKSDAGNQATLTNGGDSLTATGADPNKTWLDPNQVYVAAGTQFDLTVENVSGSYVYNAVAQVYNSSNALVSTITITLGTTSVVNQKAGTFTMPLDAAKVVVTFKDSTTDPRTARPYDPNHSKTYNGNYPTASNPDRSDPTQEGWILADTYSLGTDTLMIPVPALHDDKSTDADVWNALSDAGNAAGQPAATYKLYWKDSYGAYHQLTEGVHIQTVTYNGSLSNSYVDGNGTTHTYDGCALVVSPMYNSSIVKYYIENGGTLYITATKSTEQESDYTQVIVPRTYKATLHYTPNGLGATMEAWGKTTTADGGTLAGTNGTETVSVYNISPDTGFVVSCVVATTQSGTVNAVKTASGEYDYTMVEENVDLYVVYKKTDDPLKEKGPYIATVIKQGDDGLAGNSASVQDVDVTIPAGQKGNIWTAAYEGNVVRVDVTTEPGYYAVITATTKGNYGAAATTVSVAPFVVSNSAAGMNFYGLFYMPADDVDILVEYKQGTPPARDLTLTVSDAAADASNSATVTLPGSGITANGSSPTSVTAAVDPATVLPLTTTHATGHSVQSAELIVGGVSTNIPLTGGSSLPVPVMPMADAEIKVTFQNQEQTARPYDPDHSEKYNGLAVSGDYQHNVTTGTNPDWSQTHQEGWILATDVNKSAKSIKIQVPALYNAVGDTLENAAEAYKLYWKDSMGNFQELVSGTDVTVAGKKITGYPHLSGSGNYDGYELTVTVLSGATGNPTLWGGYMLSEYVNNGGSIYISTAATAVKAESEKTEVVIRQQDKFKATLHVNPTEGGATMEAWGDTTSTDGDTLTGTNGTETVKISNITPATGYVVSGVVATTASGSVNTTQTATGEYAYTMVGEDVDIYVVFKKADDPLKEKGPYIATVNKVNDGGLAGNDATIQDLSVTIPAGQKGNIWTAGYEGNVIRVDVTTGPGYYAVITAKTKGNYPAASNPGGTGTNIPVASFVVTAGNSTTGSASYGLFYMPDDDVDVTVEYIKGDMPKYELWLTTVGTDSTTVTGNTAKLTPTGYAAVTNSSDTTRQVPSPGTKVVAGTKIDLVTTVAANYSVKRATLTVSGMTIDISLANGAASPSLSMPMGNAEVTVEFQPGAQTARPYDPDHSTAYNSAGYPNTANPDLSDPTQEGWILASATYKNGRDTLVIEVPTLHSEDPSSPGTLYDAGDDTVPPANQPAYRVYWKDQMGNYQELSSVYATQSDTQVAVTTWSNSGTGTYLKSYQFDLTATLTNGSPTLWGGYVLEDYIANGGRLYITATGGASGTQESEKTQVVIKAEMPRPYDPLHAEAYNKLGDTLPDGTTGDYKHSVTTGDNPDLSTTHQEGWLRASSTYSNNRDTVIITVPTLHKDGGTSASGMLYDAVKNYKLYWDDNGVMRELTTTGSAPDVVFDNGVLNPTGVTQYTDGTNTYDLYRFEVSPVMNTAGTAPATDGGKALTSYAQKGGSLWITALDDPTVANQKKESEKTEVVIVVDDALRPYDPDNEATATYTPPYEDHWITSENRGDYLIVTVPMLNLEDGSDPTEVDKSKHSFHFYLVKSADVDSANPDKSQWTYQDLEKVITLSHPDPTNTTDAYENDIYYPDAASPLMKYHGARFILTPKTAEELQKEYQADVDSGAVSQADVDTLKELAEVLWAMMDNQGTDNAIQKGLDLDGDGQIDTDSNGDPVEKYRLFITHQEKNGTDVYESEYVDFEIPRYYALTGYIESYAPMHIATFTLTEENPAAGTVPMEYVAYKQEKIGAGMWRQDFKIKLTSDWDKLDGYSFSLKIEKAGHVTYDRTDIVLDRSLVHPVTGDNLYDGDELEFSFDEPIRLFAGDVDGSGAVKARDVDQLEFLIYKYYPWTKVTDPTDPGWPMSVYNPESFAYACDLNGDWRITRLDRDIIFEYANYNKDKSDYGAPKGLGGVAGTAITALIWEQWVEDILFEGREVPVWALELLEDGVEIPDWAVELIQAEQEVPAWAVTMLCEGREVPDWAVSAIAVLPQWAIDLLLAEKLIPDWAMEMAQNGEELPEELTERLANGEELPEVWPEIPVEPELPEEPVEEPEPSEPEIPEEPEQPEESDEDGEEAETPEDTPVILPMLPERPVVDETVTEPTEPAPDVDDNEVTEPPEAAETAPSDGFDAEESDEDVEEQPVTEEPETPLEEGTEEDETASGDRDASGGQESGAEPETEVNTENTDPAEEEPLPGSSLGGECVAAYRCGRGKSGKSGRVET